MYRLINESVIETNAIKEIHVKAVKAGMVITSISLEVSPAAYKSVACIVKALECKVPNVCVKNNQVVLDFTTLKDTKIVFDGVNLFKTYIKISDDKTYEELLEELSKSFAQLW